MKYKKPQVSIIIPVCNGENYLKDAIDSALGQTYQKIEVIVVNDGSTDETDRIAMSYGDKIRYFIKKNGGVASALNLALTKARGDYISWLSHDDMYEPDKLDVQFEALKNLKPADKTKTIVYSDYIFTDGKEKVIQEVKLRDLFTEVQLSHPLFGLFKQVIHGCTLLIPKNCFKKTGLFDEKLKYTQDYDLWLRMFPNFKLIHVPQLLIKSRQHDRQSSKSGIDAIVEGDELWTKMYKTITDKDKIFIGGDLDSFYTQSFSHMVAAKHFRAAQYIANRTSGHPETKRKNNEVLKKFLSMEQSAREFEAVKASKFYRLWRIYCGLKDRIKNSF